MGRRGPKKGAIYQKTRDKAIAREALRAVIDKHMESMTIAQIKHAKGLSYLVARNVITGKFEKLTAKEAERLLNGKDSDRIVVEVWEKDPSVQAYTDLMNRHLDKPTEHQEVTGPEGGPVEHVFRWQK